MRLGVILFLYRSVEIWNKLPNKLVSCKKVEEFRLKLKIFDLNKTFIRKINKPRLSSIYDESFFNMLNDYLSGQSIVNVLGALSFYF